MRKLGFAAAMIIAAFLFSGCNAEPEPSATPSPTPTPISIQSRIAAFADADVSEEDGQLIIGIRVEDDDIEAACIQFFNQAEDIWAHCVTGGEYAGISFSLLWSGDLIGSVFVLPDEGGMKVLTPVVFDTTYDNAFQTAFYDSAFATCLGD